MEAAIELPFEKMGLSLEPPYKDDNGERILQLEDITDTGERIYRPRLEPAARLRNNLDRIMQERGKDFFDEYVQDGPWRDYEPQLPTSENEADSDDDEPIDKEATNEEEQKPMTVEDLHRMRMAVLPSLDMAAGEMHLASELLSLLSTAADPSRPSPLPDLLPSGSVSGSTVRRPEPIPSVKHFDAQLTLGAKDQALRTASDVLLNAAVSLERTRKRDESYWISALTARAANWDLVPAPLPHPTSAQTARSSDQTARDFTISFGLEESPPDFKRRALAYLAVSDKDASPIAFQLRQRLRLRVSLTRRHEDGTSATHHNTLQNPDESTLSLILQYAQREIVDQEIYAELMRDAQKFPTADVRVSERIIVLEVTHGIQLAISLIPSQHCQNTDEQPSSSECDLVYSCLRLLLLRKHSWTKRQRTSTSSAISSVPTSGPRPPPVPGQAAQTPAGPIPPSVLQPVIDILCYRAFCERVGGEMRRVAEALHLAKVQAKMRMTSIGETGSDLVALLDEPTATVSAATSVATAGMGAATAKPVQRHIGGEAVLRIGSRQTIRLTFQAPSVLHAQTSQANVKISSIPQLSQILQDEVELALLDRICELGKDTCGDSKALWFVDRVSGRTMGRWNGHSATFHLSLKTGVVTATVWTIRSGLSTAVATVYAPGHVGLFAWAAAVVKNLNT